MAEDGNLNDINNCMDLLAQEFRNIKNLFLYISTSRGALSSSEPLHYPHISRLRIKDFCSEINVIEGVKNGDDKKLKASASTPEEPSNGTMKPKEPTGIQSEDLGPSDSVAIYDIEITDELTMEAIDDIF